MLMGRTTKSSRTRERRKEATFKRYVTWCKERGLAVLPLRLSNVGGYIVSFVERLGGSTRSVDQQVSQLRMYAKRTLKVEWLDEWEEWDLKDLLKELKFMDFTEVKRARPATQDIIVTLLDGRTKGNALDDMLNAVYSTSHDALLRGGEVCSDLMAGDLQEHSDRNGYTINLDRTKTAREGGPAKANVRGRSTDNFSGASRLKTWLQKSNPNKDLDRSLFYDIVWVDGVPVGLDITKSLSKDNFVKALRYDLARLGVMGVEQYTGHSFRAGGATDLFASGEMTLEQIMKVGRWKSMSAALVYYRDELITANLAAKAFGSACRRQHTGTGET
jgi:hypothetical protein